MTSVPRQLAIFAGVLLVLYAGGFAAGYIIDADEKGGHGAGQMSEEMHASPSDAPEGEVAHGEDATEAHGLSDTENGLRLSVERSEIRTGEPHEVTFGVLEEDGSPVTEYDMTHTKQMHLILVRRDTSGFQHLHPTQDEAGLWHATTTFSEGGSYRLYADFSYDGERTTLAGDLDVAGAGAGETRALPEPATLAKTTDGHSVRIDTTAAVAGAPSTLSFAVYDKRGRAVETEPYLGAGGHLVALREGDLAFLHVHPNDEGGDGISFETTFPSAARYRLYLQFKVGGRVETAGFTHEVR